MAWDLSNRRPAVSLVNRVAGGFRGITCEKADVFVNLFNNHDDDFRLWNEGSWTQTVRLWTFEQYDPAGSLIRPALDARFPMVGRTAERGEGGTLPREAAGPEISRQGVLVTSLGIDAGTRKLMLRLWEQAGKDGPAAITFPDSLDVRAVQPCDLRGRPLGKPISVEAGRLELEVQHYAPLNLELIRSTTGKH